MTAGLGDPLGGRRAARHFRRRALLLAAPLLLPAPLAPLALAQGAGPSVPAGIVGALDALFGGPHPRERAVHAKGLALKFLLPGDEDTDIVAHSYDGAPADTPEAFLEFLRAVPDPAALAALTAARPAARAFAEHPKPTPASYATEAFFAVSAFRFTNAGGVSRHGRIRVLPLAGLSHLGAGEAAARAPGFLADEMRERLARGPVGFRIVVQLAGEGDSLTDGSLPWPVDRPVVELGLLSLHALLPAEDPRLAELRFVPTNLPAGIAPTADPMLTARTQAYRLSAERRIDGR